MNLFESLSAYKEKLLTALILAVIGGAVFGMISKLNLDSERDCLKKCVNII